MRCIGAHLGEVADVARSNGLRRHYQIDGVTAVTDSRRRREIKRFEAGEILPHQLKVVRVADVARSNGLRRTRATSDGRASGMVADVARSNGLRRDNQLVRKRLGRTVADVARSNGLRRLLLSENYGSGSRSQTSRDQTV